MALVVFAPNPPGSSPTGTVNIGGGVAFDIGAALASGGGTITVDSVVSPALYQALKGDPGLLVSGTTPGTPVVADTILPAMVHSGAAGDLMVRRADGTFGSGQVSPSQFPGAELTTNKGIASGYAGLDGAGGVAIAEMPLVAQSRGLLSAVREATSALPASQSAQSHPYDTQDPTTVGVDGLAVFSAMIVSDQSGTLVVQSSADGITWNQEASVATAAVGSKQVARFSGIPSQRYVQAVETNGATPQTSNLFVTTLVALEAA